MSRNLKPDYIRKLIETQAPNGYKFDAANYLYNPHLSHEYPSFIKTIAETEKTTTIRRVYYFKHYDGTGEYMEETYETEKSGGTWQFVKQRTENILAQSNRFSLKTLLSFC